MSAFIACLDEMAAHPQGLNGWSPLHRAVADVIRSGVSSFDNILMSLWETRPTITDAHAATLLLVSLHRLSFEHSHVRGLFVEGQTPAVLTAMLPAVVESLAADVGALVGQRSNSFTGVRRFLVPQLLIGQWAAHQDIESVHFADLGTGLGLLPRQLNARDVFDRFAPDLEWEPHSLSYVPIPLASRLGVDAPPLPTLEWVRACYGASEYYRDDFEDLLWTLDQCRDSASECEFEAFDLLDHDGLTALLRARRVNVATCNFVLYQFDAPTRQAIVDSVLDGLDAPGLLLTMDLSGALATPGAVVTAYQTGTRRPLHVADTSDAHLRGTVTCGSDLDILISPRREPI